MITRRTFLQAVPAAAQTKARQPNILFIMADEWRGQATRHHGDPNVVTPVLDGLVRQSISFENATSGCPVCCPARASLMTGQYPLTNGVYINDVELKPKGTTLAEAFKEAGYRTGYIGKWHLYGSPDGNYGRRLAFIPPEKHFGFDYWKACECTHDYNRSLYYEGSDQTPKYWPGYDAFSQTDDACAFIDRQLKSADPFFLILSFGPPHFPLETVPSEFRDAFATKILQLRLNVPDDKRKDAEKSLRGYYAHMAALDVCLSKLLAALDRNQITDDTIVVFTSDHGDMMLSQGLTTKLYPWEESILIPFFLRYPRKFGKKGRRVSTPLEMPDIMPTLLKLAGLPIPGTVQGKDLSSLPTPERDATAFINLAAPITEARRYGFAEYRGLRTLQHTYVRSIRGPWLLYDNHVDPYQKNNVISNASYAKLLSSLDRSLDARLKQLGDSFLPAAEYLKRDSLTHYREVNVKVGHTRSPWGDWESTLT